MKIIPQFDVVMHFSSYRVVTTVVVNRVGNGINVVGEEPCTCLDMLVTADAETTVVRRAEHVVSPIERAI